MVRGGLCSRQTRSRVRVWAQVRASPGGLSRGPPVRTSAPAAGAAPWKGRLAIGRHTPAGAMARASAGHMRRHEPAWHIESNRQRGFPARNSAGLRGRCLVKWNRKGRVYGAGAAHRDHEHRHLQRMPGLGCADSTLVFGRLCEHASVLHATAPRRSDPEFCHKAFHVGKRPNRPTTPLNPELPYMPQVWLHTNRPTKYSPLNLAVIFWNHFSTMVAVCRARRSRTGQVK